VCERERERKRDFFIVLSYNTEIMKKYEQQKKKKKTKRGAINRNGDERRAS
jgi:hypothetical protein